MQPGFNTLNSLSSWTNPVSKIKDPLKRRWAEIVQVMDSHLSGVCPLHIYLNRRPIESQQAYAFCLNDLVRVRENDPNAVIVVLPKIRSIDEQNVSVVGVELSLVASKDIDKISKYSIRFIG